MSATREIPDMSEKMFIQEVVLCRSALENLVMTPVPLAHSSKNSSHLQCSPISDTRTGQLRTESTASISSITVIRNSAWPYFLSRQ